MLNHTQTSNVLSAIVCVTQLYAIETIAVGLLLAVLTLCGYTAIASFIIIISIRSFVFAFISNRFFFSFSFSAISFYIEIPLTIAQATNRIAFERFSLSLGVYDSCDGVCIVHRNFKVKCNRI